MIQRTVSSLAIVLCLLVSHSPATACTTFCFVDDGQVIFGKNYDWHMDDGHLEVNKHGVLRSSFVPDDARNGARWKSRYGSVTFNQYGRDFPSGGMNEKGLIVELMWLDQTVYPAPDARPSVGVLEWIQYQLDMSAVVGDVIASDRTIRIAGRSPLHYLVADPTGAVAVVEFLDGRMTTHTGASLPIAALTNNSYEDSLAFLARARAEGHPAPQGAQSLHRFARTAERVSTYHRLPPQQAVATAFATLDSAGNDRTQWSIVYDAGSRRIHFRTRSRHEIKTVELGRLDFSCDNPSLMLDMNTRAHGDVTGSLLHWSVEANIGLVRGAYAKTDFLSNVPEPEIQRIGRFPSSATCQASSGKGSAP